MIDIEGLLTESISLELGGLRDEKDTTSVLELISMIQESGIYVFMTNDMAESYAAFIANNLPVRRFMIGLAERFTMKLAMQAPDITTAASFVDSTLHTLAETTVKLRAEIQSPGSLMIGNVQASLTLTSIMDVLEGNRPFFILYLSEVTGSFRTALTQYEGKTK